MDNLDIVTGHRPPSSSTNTRHSVPDVRQLVNTATFPVFGLDHALCPKGLIAQSMGVCGRQADNSNTSWNFETVTQISITFAPYSALALPSLAATGHAIELLSMDSAAFSAYLAREEWAGAYSFTGCVGILGPANIWIQRPQGDTDGERLLPIQRALRSPAFRIIAVHRPPNVGYFARCIGFADTEVVTILRAVVSVNHNARVMQRYQYEIDSWLEAAGRNERKSTANSSCRDA